MTDPDSDSDGVRDGSGVDWSTLENELSSGTLESLKQLLEVCVSGEHDKDPSQQTPLNLKAA